MEMQERTNKRKVVRKKKSKDDCDWTPDIEEMETVTHSNTDLQRGLLIILLLAI